jgi:hypothetical protein
MKELPVDIPVGSWTFGMNPKVNEFLEQAILLSLDKDADGLFTGTCQVFTLRERKIRQNVLLTVPSGISPQAFFGMIPESKPFTTDMTEFGADGKIQFTNPVLVIVGWLYQGQGVVLSYLPGQLNWHYKRPDKPLIETQPGEPYMRSVSGSSIHIDKDGNTTFRLDDSKADNDASNVVIKISANRNVTVTNPKDCSIIMTGNETKQIGGDSSTTVTGDVKIDGDTIDLNSGSKGIARLDDQIKSTAIEDSTFWVWVQGFVNVFSTWVVVPTDGGAALKVAMLAYIAANPVPSSLTGKITVASTKVKAG